MKYQFSAIDNLQILPAEPLRGGGSKTTNFLECRPPYEFFNPSSLVLSTLACNNEPLFSFFLHSRQVIPPLS